MKLRLTLVLFLSVLMMLGTPQPGLAHPKPTHTPAPTRMATATRLPTTVPTATATASQTATTAPSSTATPSPTATTAATATSTATAVPATTAAPSATAVQPTATVLAPVDPVILGTCTAAIHDRYAVTGPDGKLYRTWHPQTVPVDPNNPSAGTCTFAHEHGDDPATSLANSSLPAFGYVGAQAGLAEPDEGFKIYVINAGAVNDAGFVALNSTRIVFHQGTAGPKRFDTEFHSLQFDLVGPQADVHVQGMADTGQLGSKCDNPPPARTVMELPGQCAVTSPYEIWSAQLTLLDRATVVIASGVFDPITLLDTASLPGQRPLLYTVNYYPQFGDFNGCKREDYAGPVYLANGGNSVTFTTDAYGNPGNLLTQQVSAVTIAPPGITMAQGNPYQMKLGSDHCAPGLGAKN